MRKNVSRVSRLATGANSVKRVTGHLNVGDQALHGNNATGKHNDMSKLKNIIKIGNWNMRGFLHLGKFILTENELVRCGIAIYGLSKTHWKLSETQYLVRK